MRFYSEREAGFTRAHRPADRADDAATWPLAGPIAGDTESVMLTRGRGAVYQRLTRSRPSGRPMRPR
ncbi:MAG: hypothetical protein M3256_05230 [Actinomycetota bacterium]|nr:hypothetical protein [Actinomycetota bacterium]